MSGCALRRWGTGTCAPRAPETAAAKEVEANFQALRAARDAQDAALWGSNSTTSAVVQHPVSILAIRPTQSHSSK